MIKNNFNHLLKKWLENRHEWANYFSLCLKHTEITDKVSREFYKDRFFLSLVLKLYFIPLNLYKYFFRVRIQHSYNKCQKEIEVLRKEIEENDKVEPGLLVEFLPEDKESK